MNSILKFEVALICTLVASTCLAGSNGYQCAISTEAELQEDGTLNKPRKASALGKRFAVDRRSGAVVEPDGEYWVFGGATNSVIASGSSDNSFIALVMSPARASGVHAVFLQVQEYVANKSKPFVLMAGGVVYTGSCQ